MTDSDFTLGVIMLDTRFPRLSGEIGNPATFPFPVRYRRVPAASVSRVVSSLPPDEGLAAAMIEAGRDLVADGADLIATSCGFLAPLQRVLADELAVPVLASALVLLPQLRALHGSDATLGVMTFDARKLGTTQLGDLAGGPMVLSGLERGRELYPAISEDREALDPIAAEADAREAARSLKASSPDLAAVVLECTNLSPYRRAIAEELGCPVYDLVQAVVWHASIRSASRLSARDH